MFQSDPAFLPLNHCDTLRKASACVVAAALLSSTCLAQTASVTMPAPPSVIAAATAVPGSENSISRVSSGAETLHLVVGHSLFLNTKYRLRKVYVADPAILNSITLSPTQLIVTAMTPGLSSVIVIDEKDQAQSYVVSSDLDVQSLRTAMSGAMREHAVEVEGNGARVTLSGNVGTKEQADTAVKLASLYAKDVANSLSVVPDRPKQVRLKVRILEVDRTKVNQFGINLFNPGGNTSFLASTTTSQFTSTSTLSAPSSANAIGALATTSPLNFLLYSSKLNLGATIQDLENKNVLQVLAEPTITTISGQKADFLSGGEFPFPVIQPGGSGGTSSVTIQFKPYGVKVEFTPIVNEDGTIRLKVAPEVSALDYANAVSISGYTIPALSTRKADTEVELRSNQSFAISGLLDQRTTDLYSKTPGAANIPILGALFKSKNINHSTTELIVIVTPSLVDPLSDTVEPQEPKLPIPTLDQEKFDKSLGKRLNPNPDPPPLNALPTPMSIEPEPSPIIPAAAIPPPPAVSKDSVPTPSVEKAPAGNPAGGIEVAAAVAKPVHLAVEMTNPLGPGIQLPGMTTMAAPRRSLPQVAKVVTPPPPPTAQKVVFDHPASAPPAPAVPEKPMVQIVTLSHKEDADAMVTAFKRHGLDVSVNQDPLDSLLHLEVGPFKNTSEAEAMRQRLMTDGYNATVKNR